jgi:hypothetical protein
MVRIKMAEIHDDRTLQEGTEVIPWITELIDVVDQSDPCRVLFESHADTDEPDVE